MNAKTLHCRNVAQLRQQLVDCLASDFSPKLAIVFASVKHDFVQLNKVFAEFKLDVAGCSTAGEIVNGFLYEESISILLLDVDRSFYQTHCVKYSRQNVRQTSFDFGRHVRQCFENPALLIMSGGLAIDAVELIKGVKEGVGREIPIYGGLAGDDLDMRQTFAFTACQTTDMGMAV